MLMEVEQKNGQNYAFAEHFPTPPPPEALPVPINPKSHFQVALRLGLLWFHGCLAFLRQQIYFSTQQLISRRYDDHHRHCFHYILLETGSRKELKKTIVQQPEGSKI